jgi:hypothetical protein
MTTVIAIIESWDWSSIMKRVLFGSQFWRLGRSTPGDYICSASVRTMCCFHSQREAEGQDSIGVGEKGAKLLG